MWDSILIRVIDIFRLVKLVDEKQILISYCNHSIFSVHLMVSVELVLRSVTEAFTKLVINENNTSQKKMEYICLK